MYKKVLYPYNIFAIWNIFCDTVIVLCFRCCFVLQIWHLHDWFTWLCAMNMNILPHKCDICATNMLFLCDECDIFDYKSCYFFYRYDVWNTQKSHLLKPPVNFLFPPYKHALMLTSAFICPPVFIFKSQTLQRLLYKCVLFPHILSESLPSVTRWWSFNRMKAQLLLFWLFLLWAVCF